MARAALHDERSSAGRSRSRSASRRRRVCQQTDLSIGDDDRVTSDQPTATMPRVAATMTVLAMGLGYAITNADPTILSANLSEVRAGLHMSPSTASFAAGLATLTLAAAVLGAGALGDRFGMRRMFVSGLVLAIVFGVGAALAPNTAVLLLARGGVGIAFAFLLGLSLAIVNAVFPPEARASAIALYLGAGFAFTTPLPALGSFFAEQFGWRTCFLVTPLAALVALVITVRYVPETARSARRLDAVGLGLIAVALVTLVYGISQLQTGPTPHALIPLGVGIAAFATFMTYESRTPEPALDLRVFRSGRFNAAVLAGATFNFLTGGSTVLFAYYLVIVRDESPAVLGLLLIPATLLQAVAATAAGRAAQRVGDRTVLIIGLALLLGGLLALTVLDEHSSLAVLFVAIALNAVGGAMVQTPQATIMMASAPADLGGTVSAVKSAIGQAGYSLGPTLFALIGTTLFLRASGDQLAEAGISRDEAHQAFQVAHGGAGAPPGGVHVLDAEQAQRVVAAANTDLMDAVHTLSLIMATVPAVAIVAAIVLLRPTR